MYAAEMLPHRCDRIRKPSRLMLKDARVIPDCGDELSWLATELPAEVFPEIVHRIGVIKALALEQGFGISRPGKSAHRCCGDLRLGAVFEKHAADAGLLDGVGGYHNAVVAQQHDSCARQVIRQRQSLARA